MYTLEDLMSFGAYLLSDERIERRQDTAERNEYPFELLQMVHAEDLHEWLTKQRNAANPQ